MKKISFWIKKKYQILNHILKILINLLILKRIHKSMKKMIYQKKIDFWSHFQLTRKNKLKKLKTLKKTKNKKMKKA